MKPDGLPFLQFCNIKFSGAERSSTSPPLISMTDALSRNKVYATKTIAAYHQKHSLPIMLTIQARCESDLNTETVEANSNLGKAMKSFLKHFQALTQFCKIQGVPLDNNRTEGVLKIVIRNRKNAYFYKTAKGAEVSDIITSVLATCMANQINAFEYLCQVQRNHDVAKIRPQEFLPWNYQIQIEKNRLN